MMKRLGIIVACLILAMAMLAGCAPNDGYPEDVYIQGDLYVWNPGTSAYEIVNGALGGGAGDVTAAANIITDMVVVGDGGLKGIKDTGVSIDGFDNLDTNGGDLTGFDIWADNDVNVTNDLDVTDDALIGGALTVTGLINLVDIASHGDRHIVGGADSVYPVDPGADKYLMWDDGLGVLSWEDAGGAPAYTDDIALNFGTGNPVSLLWETADANANALLLGLPVSNGTDIPALVIGDVNTVNVDLTLLNSFTFPSLNVVDTDRDSYLTLTYSADDAPMIIGNRNIQLKPNADLDDYFTFATVSDIPTIYGTGSYTRFGDAATANRITSSEDNVHFSGMIEVDNTAYFEGGVYLYSSMTASTNGNFETADNQQYRIGSSSDAAIAHVTSDSNANLTMLGLPIGTTVNVPVLYIREKSNYIDVGLFDGITQPQVVVMDKDEQLHSATDGIADAGGATAILKHTGGFTNAVVGDIVRITAGTNCTVGWYWVTTVTSANQVTLDRNYTSANTTNCTFVTFHSFPMIGADGVCLKTFDGAPSDSNTEIDRDGWLMLDVGQTNGRLYWRANNAWHYVDATAGISLPANERVDKNGHEFQIGDTVQFYVDMVNNDGSFHALPYYGGSNITDEAVIKDLVEQILKEKGLVK
jgi:hypothetical protein